MRESRPSFPAALPQRPSRFGASGRLCLALFGITIFLLLGGPVLTAEERTPVRVAGVEARGSDAFLAEVARTIRETLCLSVVLLDELTLIEEGEEAPEGTIELRGGVEAAADSGYLLSVVGVDEYDGAVIIELEESAQDLFSIFSAVDLLAEGLLSAVAGREIRFGSVMINVEGYGTGGELLVDDNRVAAFPYDEKEAPDPKNRRYAIDRLPAGDHQIAFRQPRLEGELNLSRRVTVEAGSREQATFVAPPLTPRERSSLLSARYNSAVESFLRPRNWALGLDTEELRPEVGDARIPSKTVESDIRLWNRRAGADQKNWYIHRSYSLPYLPVVVDGDPSEWTTVVPVALRLPYAVAGLEGDGSELNSARLAAEGDTIFFLIDVKGEVSSRFTYRLYFDIDDPRWATVSVILNPGEESHVVLLVEPGRKEYTLAPATTVGYRQGDHFIEGEIQFGAGEIERIKGINHFGVSHPDKEIANTYSGAPFVHRGGAVAKRLLIVDDPAFARSTVPIDAALRWVRDLGY